MLFAIPDSDLMRLVQGDVPCGDVTTTGLGIATQPGRATFPAATDMTVACIEDAVRMLELCDCRCTRHSSRSATVRRDALLLEANGFAGNLHRGGKTAQLPA